jgi:hypothetical protein
MTYSRDKYAQSIALSFGIPLVRRTLPFNKEIVRAVKYWEQQTGLKFHGKVLKGEGFFNYKNILVPSNKFTVFHELFHYKHQGIRPIRKEIFNWWHYGERFNISYYKMSCERYANREAKKMMLNRRIGFEL